MSAVEHVEEPRVSPEERQARLDAIRAGILARRAAPGAAPATRWWREGAQPDALASLDAALAEDQTVQSQEAVARRMLPGAP